jgi:hypothetical protein
MSLREMTAQVEQELRDVGSAVELVLDPRERAAPIPERTLLAGAALSVALGDQLDRAELPMLDLRFHVLTMPVRRRRAIGNDADLAAGSY